MTPPEIRRRRRKTISTTNLQPRPRLAEPTSIVESIFSTETELSQTQLSEVEPKPQPTDQQQTTLESTSDPESIKPSPARKMQIDEIHAELTNESNFNPDEPEYWDETHDLSHNLSESDDYWHFVGRYE